MERVIFDKFRELIHKTSGIYLADEKQALLENRLRKILRSQSLSNESEYLKIIETDASGEELIQLIDAISTNHTFFFREKAHFDFLKQDLKENSTPGKEVKLWCAASSSGEEPYSLAMTMEETLNPLKVPYKILATDICTRVLNAAIRGKYDESQLKEIPKEYINKYFSPLHPNDIHDYEISIEMRKKVLYKRMNLAKFPYPLNGKLDYIFCRNVMIYFKEDLKEKIANEFYKLLNPGGYLIIGHSESLGRTKHAFKMIKGSLYRKED